MSVTELIELEFHAEQAWGKYASACRMGGTESEREFAYAQASKAQEKLRLAIYEPPGPVKSSTT